MDNFYIKCHPDIIINVFFVKVGITDSLQSHVFSTIVETNRFVLDSEDKILCFTIYFVSLITQLKSHALCKLAISTKMHNFHLAPILALQYAFHTIPHAPSGPCSRAVYYKLYIDVHYIYYKHRVCKNQPCRQK